MINYNLVFFSSSFFFIIKGFFVTCINKEINKKATDMSSTKLIVNNKN